PTRHTAPPTPRRDHRFVKRLQPRSLRSVAGVLQHFDTVAKRVDQIIVKAVAVRVELARQADELSPFGLAVLLEPVGKYQSRQVIVRVGRNCRDELCFRRHRRPPATPNDRAYAMISLIGLPKSMSRRLWPGTSSLRGSRPSCCRTVAWMSVT